jgi:hypothetical protein
MTATIVYIYIYERKKSKWNSTQNEKNMITK